MENIVTIDYRAQDTDKTVPVVLNGYVVRLVHEPQDAPSVNRLLVSRNNCIIELQPSKGFSFGKIMIDDTDLLWDPPIGIPDPDTLNLWSDEICIHGEPVAGATFLKTFSGSIELYGLRNWGMMYTSDNGEIFPLHGETSNIPIEKVEIRKYRDGISLTGSFLYRTFKDRRGNKPWYNQGKVLFRVVRKIYLYPGLSGVEFTDEIINISRHAQSVQWGYHFTFKPEEGCYIDIPAKEKQARGGGQPRENFNVWPPPHTPGKRTEEGVILRGIETKTGVISPDKRSVSATLHYPDAGRTVLTFLPAPYLQSWMSVGDATEFTYRDGTRIFNKPWNGIGLEIGSDALDHDGNIDPDIPGRNLLQGGESVELPFRIERI